MKSAIEFAASGKMALASIGDIHGEPVTTPKTYGEAIHHNYLIWIGLDKNGMLDVRKFRLHYPARQGLSLDQGEIALATKAHRGEPSDWPSSAGPANELYSIEFHGTGRFSIILGVPDWQFYDFDEAGHEPVVFHKYKEFYDTDENGKPFLYPAKGTYNRSFYNGKTDFIEVSGNKLAIFRCENLIQDEDGLPLPEGITKPLLFDINVRIPIGSTGKYALIVIDPVGGNEGPPGAP